MVQQNVLIPGLPPTPGVPSVYPRCTPWCTLGVPSVYRVVKCPRIITTTLVAAGRELRTINHGFSETENDQCHGVTCTDTATTKNVIKNVINKFDNFFSLLNTIKNIIKKS